MARLHESTIVRHLEAQRVRAAVLLAVLIHTTPESPAWERRAFALAASLVSLASRHAHHVDRGGPRVSFRELTRALELEALYRRTHEFWSANKISGPTTRASWLGWVLEGEVRS